MEVDFTKSLPARRARLTREAIRGALAARFRAYLDRAYGRGPDSVRAIAAEFDITERQARNWRDRNLDVLPGLEILVTCAGFEAVERLIDGLQ